MFKKRLYDIITSVVYVNNLVLAYLGDAVYELWIREYLINKGLVKVNDLQVESLKYVSAKNQAMFLNKLLENNILSEDEIDIVKRGRNAKSHSKKNIDIVTYKKSTGLECLIGSLKVNNNIDRINEIMNFIVGGNNESNR